MALPFHSIKRCYMQWEVINNPKSILHEYHLMDSGECKVIVKYNPIHQSARVTCGNHQRLFFIESSGSLSGKAIFKNEYGMEIGSITHDRWHLSEGNITIDDKKFHYGFKNNPLVELTIYNSITQQPLVSCGLKVNNSGNGLTIVTTPIEANCFLLSLCWYLFLPIAKENLAEYAA